MSNTTKSTKSTSTSITRRIFNALEQLSSSKLLLLMGGLFILDMMVPDPIFLLDEIALGISTLLLARWQMRAGKKKQAPPVAEKPPTKNVTPPAA